MFKRARGGPDELVGVYLIVSNLFANLSQVTKQIPEVVPSA